jgi:hypothetical protein
MSVRVRYRFTTTAALADYFAGKASALREARKFATRQRDGARILGEAYAWESAGHILRNAIFDSFAEGEGLENVTMARE